MNRLSLRTQGPTIGAVAVGLFVLLQVGIFGMAVTDDSLWIDEFWTAHFAALPSLRDLLDLLLVPSGSQTPLHFAHYFAWGQLFGAGEWSLRWANLPLFVAGQLALFWALRRSGAAFAALLLGVGAFHPMVWQYANEARQYIMMFAGAQLMLAALIELRARTDRHESPGHACLALFVAGALLLFGSSLLGVFWVLAAFAYAVYFHVRRIDARYLLRGANPWLLGVSGVAMAALSVYYLGSLLNGAGASRISSTTVATMLFAGYELLGLSGIGPSRLQLRDAGVGALAPYAVLLLPACLALLATLWVGGREAARRVERQELIVIAALGALPIAIVLLSGFVMHWRVLGRHMIAALPLLNLLFALGLMGLLAPGRGRALRAMIAVVCVVALVGSALALRFAPRHEKDDYRAAAQIARLAASQGQRVWWAADSVGATYYRLPGEFDHLGELTGQHRPLPCHDLPGVQSVPNAPAACLQRLSMPDLVILSKPESFDTGGAITAYLTQHRFVRVQALPAFVVWRAPRAAGG